jgi:hypothetical protein
MDTGSIIFIVVLVSNYNHDKNYKTDAVLINYAKHVCDAKENIPYFAFAHC